MMLKGFVLILSIAGILAGCSTTSGVSASRDVQVQSIRNAVGTDLIGTEGKTPQDQNNIDNTIAGLCGSGAYRPSECAQHGGR